MKEKPKKRLVSKGHYVRTLMDKTIMFSVAGLVLLIGLLLLTIAVFSMNDVAGMIFALIPGAFGIAALVYSRRLFVERKKIEPVKPTICMLLLRLLGEIIIS